MGALRYLGAYLAVFSPLLLHLVVHTHRVYGAYTMEVIIATTFGRAIEIQKGQSNQLTEAAMRVAQESSVVFWLMILSEEGGKNDTI